jgi:predicted aspartyl protease
MRVGLRLAAAAMVIAAAGFVIRADDTIPSAAAEIQLQLGQLLFQDGRFADALVAFQQAEKTDDASRAKEARAGVVQSALRVARFDLARREAEILNSDAPASPSTMALYADTLWADGMFEEAEAKYQEAVAIEPNLARGLHGIAKSLLARSQLGQAMNEAQAALRLSPRDLENHHTVGAIYERMHRFDEAAAAYTNYTNLLPHKDTSEKAAWARSEIEFLKAFGTKVPFEVPAGTEDMLYTVDFRLDHEKILVKASVNGAEPQDFVLDTGSENTVISRGTARHLGVNPITTTISAGVGDSGFRGLGLARLDSLQIGGLKMRNVPCIIKDPPLRDLPRKETESFSPLALGLSVTIDYAAHRLTIGRELPDEPADFSLPLRMYRLATVRGTIDGSHAAHFVVDTGGQVISISQSMAASLGLDVSTSRRIPVMVYGNSGWDRDAFLLVPGIDLTFDTIRYRQLPVVVLNLSAPSALLGYRLGGIVGHKFLSNYRVGIDLDRSVLRLTRTGGSQNLVIG